MGQSAVQNYESPAADPAEPAEDRSHYPELRGPGGMKRSKSDVELALNLTPHGQPPASATASGIGGTGWTANPAHEDGGRTTTWRRSANSVLPSPDSEVFEIDSPSLLDHEPMSYTSTATSTTTTGPPTAMLSPHRRPVRWPPRARHSACSPLGALRSAQCHEVTRHWCLQSSGRSNTCTRRVF